MKSAMRIRALVPHPSKQIQPRRRNTSFPKASRSKGLETNVPKNSYVERRLLAMSFQCRGGSASFHNREKNGMKTARQVLLPSYLLSYISRPIFRSCEVTTTYLSTLMKNIPLELLRPIIEHLDDDSQSLLAVSLASRVLRVEGQRILFRTMTLLKDKEAHIKFLTVVTSSSMLAQLVEEYWQFDLLDVDHEQEPLWRLTCRGLNAMVNLKHLFFSTLSGRPCAQILRGCTFQLEVLRWENHDDAEQLLEFLPSQPHLRTLGVEWKNPELITSGICPGLQVLHGNQGAINAFLPGRSITSLKWSPDQMESSDGPINHLSQEFHHIRFFSFGGYFGRPPLSFIIPQLPLLEVLELIGLHSFEVCSNLSLRLRLS